MTTHSIARSPAVTCCVSGSDCAMSSPWIYRPLNVPPTASSSMFGIRKPGSADSVTPQVASNISRAASSVTCRYPLNSCGKLPMSQAP